MRSTPASAVTKRAMLVTWIDFLLLAAGLARPGRPGEMRSGHVFCPLTGSWLGKSTELEVSGNRTFYDEHQVDALIPEAADFNRAAIEARWKLPEQLLEAVTVCEYCEAYCLGKADAPLAVPPVREIDRNAVLRDLYPND